MNKRIFELAQKAGYSSWELNPSKETMSDAPERLRKFALLIVRECLTQVFWYDEDEHRITDSIHERIKQHFGVENDHI